MNEIPAQPYRLSRWISLSPRPSHPAVGRQDRATSHFHRARNALFHGLRILGLTATDEVIVPAFVCRTVPEAIAGFGAKPVFVDTLADCSFDLEILVNHVSDRTKAIVAIHYFGQTADLGALVDLCRSRGIFLIEDCAHSLNDGSSEPAVGDVGDIAIFSFRKLLSIPDGGCVVVNNSSLTIMEPTWEASWRRNLAASKQLLDQAFANGWAPHARRAIEGARDVVRSLRPVSRNASAAERYQGRSDDEFDYALRNWPISDLSRLVLRHTRVADVVAARRRNYQFLVEQLSRLKAIQPLYPLLKDSATPWILPVRIHGIPRAHLAFRQQGIPATHWGDVRPRGIEVGVYPVADRLFEDLIFLPVHQDLTSAHLDGIVAAADAISKQSPNQPHYSRTRDGADKN